MEAGLPSTKGEERMMSKEPLLPEYEDTLSRTTRQKPSTARRVFFALAICSVIGLGLAALGSATHLCPGHLRMNLSEKVEAVVGEVHGAINTSRRQHRARDAKLARRQTPGAEPTTTNAPASSTQPSSEPTSNAAPTSNEETQSVAATTDSVQSEASSSPASETQPASTRDSQPTSTDAQSTNDSETTSAPGTSSSEEQPSQTSSSSPSSATASSAATSEEPTSTSELESTVTTGTRRTSSAVQKVFTSTMKDGGVTTLTSTSWLAVVPSADAKSDNKGGEPGLQNEGSQYSVAMVLQAALGMIAGGMLLL